MPIVIKCKVQDKILIKVNKYTFSECPMEIPFLVTW